MHSTSTRRPARLRAGLAAIVLACSLAAVSGAQVATAPRAEAAITICNSPYSDRHVTIASTAGGYDGLRLNPGACSGLTSRNYIIWPYGWRNVVNNRVVGNRPTKVSNIQAHYVRTDRP